MKRLHYRWLALGAVALFASACAQSNGDINRVQPNVVKKADLLDGTWYFRNTVTWAPATTGFTFTGETGNLEKLVWEIQEGNLVGYRSYAYLPGSEGRIEDASKPSGTTATYCQDGKCVGGHKYYGAPIVAYPIVSHFDIQRNYNAATGEVGNVIQENSSDRPWNEREFIRVDWSASWVNQGTEMVWNTVQNPTGATDINAWIQANEPGTDPYDWPVQEFTKNPEGESKLTYFDFTGRYFAKPETYYYEGYGDVPMCWLSPRYDCTSAEIRMRTSISKIDPKKVNDYEPLVYGNDLMTKFGFFRTERLTYNRQFGITEQGRIFLANRFNIWKETFNKDAAGNPDQTSPIPFDQRDPKPILYYVTPADRMGGEAQYRKYLEASRTLQANWDVAFRRAVAAAQNKDPKDVPQMLHVCENPVPKFDTLTGAENTANGPCGAPGTAPKFGDLRYSFMYTITDPTPNGLLGYGPSSADPETGEIVSANANTYSGAVDTYAQYGLDVVDTLTGEKTIDQLISGDDVRAYFAALENKSYAHLERNIGKSQAALEVFAELQDVTRSNAESLGSFDRPTDTMAGKLAALRVQGGLPVASQDRARVAAEMLKAHPQLESVLLDNPEMKNDALAMLPAAIANKAQGDGNVAREALRNVLLNYPAFNNFEKRRVEWASRRNMYLAEFLDRPMFGLAKREAKRRADRLVELKAAGESDYNARVIADNEIRRRIAQAVWRATSEHEIGHTFGLRHNFQASFDSINYFDRYWEVKKPFLTVNQGGNKVLPRTPNDLRAVSDATGAYGAAIANANNAERPYDSIFDYEYSSIMDYGGKMNSDFAGIGKYDEAAIIFAYSGGREPGYVEVFNQVRKDAIQVPGSDGNTVTLTGAGYDLPIVNAQHKSQAIPNYQERFHYGTVPLRFGEGATIDGIIDSGIARLKSGNRSLMKWSEVKAKHAQVSELLKSKPVPTTAELPAVPLEVPYMFCTDDHVGYVLSCNRFDRGPDYLEMNRQWIEDYWNDYYFNHFRRDRYAFSANSAINSAFGTFDEASLVYKHWVRQFYAQNVNATSQVLENYNVDQNMQDTWSMAVFDGANELLKVMSVPPAGYFGYIGAQPGPWAPCSNCWTVASEGDEFASLNADGRTNLENFWKASNRYRATKFATMPRGIGRRMYSRYDFRSGFGFWDRMVEVGHYYDQYGAMFAAVMPDAYFLDTDDTADFRRYQVPYYLVFNQELSTVFGSIWSNDEAFRRPRAYISDPTAAQPTLELAFKSNITPSKYVKDFNYVTEKTTFTTEQTAAPANVSTTWSARIYSIYLGMALFNVNYDLDYAKQNQVWKVGMGESIPDANIPAGYTAHYVDDIFTGARYAAVQPSVIAKDTPAVRMIKLAQDYKQDYEQFKVDPQAADYPTYLQYLGEVFRDQVRDLDMMRGMYAVYGKAF